MFGYDFIRWWNAPKAYLQKSNRHVYVNTFLMNQVEKTKEEDAVNIFVIVTIIEQKESQTTTDL